MKGVVFNLLEETVVAEHGEDTWDDLLDAAGVEGAYTSLGSYPDAELERLVGAIAERLGATPAETLRWFGRRAIPRLSDTYPEFFARHEATIPFLLTLNDIIHPEVRKLYPGAGVPEFDYDTSHEPELRMGYSSPRALCALAEGFILGAADHYEERIVVEQSRCVHRGDPACLLRVVPAP